MDNQITNEMVKKLISVYKSNEDELYRLDAAIDEHGILDDGTTDIHNTYEMGYHSALQYVFEVLGIKER